MLKPPIRSRVTSSGTGSVTTVQKRGSPKKPQPTSPASQQVPKKKTSKEIIDTVNGFIQEARLKSKAFDKNKPSVDEKKRNFLQRSALYKTAIPLESKTTGRTAKIPTHNKDVKQTTGQITGKVSSIANNKRQMNQMKRTVHEIGKKLNNCSLPGRAFSPNSSPTQQESVEETLDEEKLSTEPLEYEVSSSDEESGDSNDDDFLRTDSPTPKSKICSEQIVHGPSSTEWKFRAPAAGGKFNELGAEELSPILRGIKLDKRPNHGELINKRRELCKAVNTPPNDIDSMETKAEKNIRLKKFYSQQLDSMREKALASLKKFHSTADEVPTMFSPSEDIEGREPTRIPQRFHDSAKPISMGLKSNLGPQRQPAPSFGRKSVVNSKFGPKSFNRGDGTFGRGVHMKLENGSRVNRTFRGLFPQSQRPGT